MFNKSGLTAMQKGKLEKALAKLYSFYNGHGNAPTVMSLGDYIQGRPWTHKKTTVEIYSRKEIHLEKPLLEKPKYDYAIGDDAGYWLSVPKMVYDALDFEDTTDHEENQSQIEEHKREFEKQIHWGRYSSDITRW